jgi:hypothetical protein
MDTIQSTPPLIQTYPIPYLWFLFTILVTVGLFVGLEYGANLANIGNNWPEYRCQPHIIPLAGLFGHDINENFQFCLQQIIQENTKGVTGPFAQGMSGFTSVLMNLMNSANSFRTMLATLVGGIVKIVSEFKARMTALMGRVKISASRMKAMMYRVYGTMFAVIYMGMSAQTGIANFGDTFIFKFIDTFCFPPEQPIVLTGNSVIPISDVKLGDLLLGGQRVETIYRFAADGQEMVKLKDVEVSSNHFVQHGARWIFAKDHPDARPSEPWSGGPSRPLICLSTADHIIPIGSYIFADYDETEEGNAPTQQWVDMSLNGRRKLTPHPGVSYEIGSPSHMVVKTMDGYIPLDSITLGTQITPTSKVVGIQISRLYEFCKLPSGLMVAPGTLIWNTKTDLWERAYKRYPTDSSIYPIEMTALFVSPGAQYELLDGTVVRDAMEVYSPDTKRVYAEILLKQDRR